MAKQARDRGKTTETAKDAVAEVLASMPLPSKDALRARLATLTAEDIEQLAAADLLIQLQKLHAQLSADFEAAQFLVQNPMRRPIVTEDNLPVLKVVHGNLRQARAGLTSLATLNGLGTQSLRDALTEFQGVYRVLEYSIEWQTFSDAIEELKAATKRAENADRQAQQEAQQRDARQTLAEIQVRIDRWLGQARAAGQGDGKVKCVVITPDGRQAVTGHAGALDTRRIHVALQKLLDSVAHPAAPWDKTNCAEVDGLNQLLFAHYGTITEWRQIPEGMTLRAYAYGAGGWKNRGPCENCSQWMAKIKARKDATVG